MTVLPSEEYHFTQRKIFGWANTHFSYSDIVLPETTEAIYSIIKRAVYDGRKILGCGAGHSYGDQSLNKGQVLVDMNKMKDILKWDERSGLLCVQSGATFDQVLNYCLGSGWIPAVIPGTRYVTMGGALSNNVHGKNSYARGNFGDWVREFKIVLASGECRTCSKETNKDLFFGVIGGAGLLGIVTEMTLQLVRIPSAYLSVQKVTASGFDELMNKLDNLAEKNEFAIAQVDCFPKTRGLGRGTIHSGSFVASNRYTDDLATMQSISKKMFGVFPKNWIPMIGKYFLNDYTMKWVSLLKYYFDKKDNPNNTFRDDIFHFTFLLDQVPDWKKVFRYGFFEYEPLIPKDKARMIIPQLIALTHKYDMPAYLSAIKIHRRDDFMLSYSMDGYSFAMDIPRRPKQKEKQDELFQKMNKIIMEVNGIVYLAKDANLTHSEFRDMYKNFEPFLLLKKKYDPDELFQSDMYRRIFKNNKR